MTNLRMLSIEIEGSVESARVFRKETEPNLGTFKLARQYCAGGCGMLVSKARRYVRVTRTERTSTPRGESGSASQQAYCIRCGKDVHE